MITNSYTDRHGRTHREIQLDWLEQTLVIKDQHGKKLARWGYRHIQALATSGEFAPRNAKLERVRLVDDAAANHLRLKLSEQGLHAPLIRREIVGTAGIIIAILAFWLVWPPLADQLTPLIPEKLFVSLGKASLASIKGSGGECKVTAAQPAQAALAALMKRLDLEKQNIILINDREINAFALPGGSIVVMRGLLEKAATPEELAGVIAHEAGHVQHRHAERSLLRQGGLNLFLTMMLGGDFFGQVSQQALVTKYSRDFEREADRFALDKLRQAAISPLGLADFYARIRRQSGSDRLPFNSWLSTHPRAVERESQARAAAATIKAGPPVLDNQAWQALQTACRLKSF